VRVEEVYAKRAPSRHKRDPWFLDKYALNPYVSCEFNCVYCYARDRQRPGYLRVKVDTPLCSPGISGGSLREASTASSP